MTDYNLDIIVELQKHNNSIYKLQNNCCIGLFIHNYYFPKIMNRYLLNFIYKNDIMFYPRQTYFPFGSHLPYHNDYINKIFYAIIGHSININTIDSFIEIINDNNINDDYIIYILCYYNHINSIIIEYITKYFGIIYIDIVGMKNYFNISLYNNCFIYYRHFHTLKIIENPYEIKYNHFDIVRDYWSVTYKKIFYNKLLYTFILLIMF